MQTRLDAAACLPADGTAGLLVGRAWQTEALPGPAVVVLREHEAIDVSSDFPTIAHLLNAEAPADNARAAAARGKSLGPVEALIANSAEAARDTARPFLLAPCDLQALKACGVTFVRSLLERVIDPIAGRAARAAVSNRGSHWQYSATVHR